MFQMFPFHVIYVSLDINGPSGLHEPDGLHEPRSAC